MMPAGRGNLERALGAFLSLDVAQAAVDQTLLLKPQRDLWWQWLFICAVGVAAVLKNSAFSEEREWRFIHLATDYAGMMFRPRSTGLVPFVQLQYGQDRSDKALPFKLPITALWSGPGRAVDIALLAGRALLEKYE
jgi:hypothetical protein